MNIKKTDNLCKTLTKPQKTVCISCSKASCSLKPAVDNKINGISAGKIFKNGLRAIVLGIVLYAAYDQFFASKKTTSKIEAQTKDTVIIKNKITAAGTVKKKAEKLIFRYK